MSSADTSCLGIIILIGLVDACMVFDVTVCPLNHRVWLRGLGSHGSERVFDHFTFCFI